MVFRWPSHTDPPPQAILPSGLCYVCRRCDVYGWLPAGADRVCWCCGQGDCLAGR